MAAESKAKDGDAPPTSMEEKRKAKAERDAARAAESNGSDPTSIEQKAQEAAAAEEEGEPEEVVEKLVGDRQLTIPKTLFGGKKVSITKQTLSIGSAEREIDGMFETDREVVFMVRVLPGKVELVPERSKEKDDLSVTGFKARQHAAVTHVTRVEDGSYNPQD